MAPLKMMRKLPTPPLWLFGLFEAIQAVLATVLLVVIPVTGISLARNWQGFDPLAAGELAAQAWLVIHAVPLYLSEGETGWFHLVPLGFTLIPVLLAWRTGRRLAQGSYPSQLWQGLALFTAGYTAAGVGLARFAAQDPGTMVWAGVACTAVVGIGSLAGCYAEARSATRMIGVDLEARVEEFSQHLKWAGAYIWAVLRAGLVASVAALGLAAVLLAGWLAVQWMEVANSYQELGAGIFGGLGLTLLHLGLAPNMVLWALAYSTGSGFTLGTDAPVTPFTTELGGIPEVPVLGAVPQEAYTYAPAVLVLPVFAGVIAGVWFMREGENHFDDWCQLRLKVRAVSMTVSTLVLGALTGAVAAVVLIGPLWLSHISLGVGRMTDIGPHGMLTALLLACWVGLGTMIGYLAAPGVKMISLPRRRRNADSEEFSATAGS